MNWVYRDENFQKHDQTKIMHVDQNVDNWESNFWLLAVEAIKGNKEYFENRLKNSLPFIKFPIKYSKKEIFKIYNEIINFFGHTLFDKSPQYLGNDECLNLIKEYNNIYKNIIFLGLIRNPLDSIISQYQLWKEYDENDSLKKREKRWLIKYNHLIKLKKDFSNLDIIKYEDLVADPENETKKILDKCGLKFDNDCWQHLKEISIGRYQAFQTIGKHSDWKWSDEFDQHLKDFNYHPNNQNKISFLKKLRILFSSYKRFIPLNIKTKIKALLNRND